MTPSIRNHRWVLGVLVTLLLGHSVAADAVDPEGIIAGTDERIDAIFHAQAGKPLKRASKHPPLSKGRGNYVRGYSFSIVGFAARCLHLDEQLDQANAALAENAQYYLDNELSICDRDSFHWHADVVMRLIEMYGSKGTAAPGRITPKTEALLLKPIWIYASRCSWLKSTEFKKSQTWNMHSSENHHAMHFTVCWHFAKLAKDRPEYKDRVYKRGGTAADHYRAWNDYFVVYCMERARKGICVEMMSPGYNNTMMKALYNFHDFGEPAQRKAAKNLLDLYFAYWAQEQIDGVVGGGQSRIYFDKGLKARRTALSWLYFGIGKQPTLNGHDINPYLSSYRPPAVIVDMAMDVQGRGRYEVYQRVQGRGKQGHTFPKMDAYDRDVGSLHTDGGGILRYSYCDPAFILGTPMHEPRPLSDWVHISAQNRWQGVIFAGDEDARIVPIARPQNMWRALNAQWSVQAKGTLITQKLRSHKGAGDMIVWLSKEGLSEPIESDGIIFVKHKHAYAAIRVVNSTYRWDNSDQKANSATGQRNIRPGRMLITEDPYAPVILEVMPASNGKSFDAFVHQVKASMPQLKDGLLTYTSIYGDTLTFDTNQKQTQTINGRPVDFAPKQVYNSPFLNADYNAGVVTITKGKRKHVLDFNP